jgi:hypothetical protein
MSYAAISDLQNAYRLANLLDLVTDGTQGPTGSRPLTLTGNTIAQAALDYGAGLINASCLVGQRYTEAELAALTGVDLALLVGLNCDLAYGRLLKRVGKGDPPPAEVVTAMEMLKAIEEGQQIFNVPADVAASLTTINFPSASTYRTVNLLRDYCNRAFPGRNKQNPAPN